MVKYDITTYAWNYTLYEFCILFMEMYVQNDMEKINSIHIKK